MSKLYDSLELFFNCLQKMPNNNFTRSKSIQILRDIKTQKFRQTDALDTLITAIIWQPPNLMEGPSAQLRVDDPGSNLDKFSDLPGIVGNSKDRQKAYTYENFYSTLNGIGVFSDPIGKREFNLYEIRKLNSVIRDIEILKNKQETTFIPAMWEEVKVIEQGKQVVKWKKKEIIIKRDKKYV